MGVKKMLINVQWFWWTYKNWWRKCYNVEPFMLSH